VNNPKAIRIPRHLMVIQDKRRNTDLPHDFLIKGSTATFTIERYLPASLDWVVQHKWHTLHLKELPQYNQVAQ
jgi:hypothetical protein